MLLVVETLQDLGVPVRALVRDTSKASSVIAQSPSTIVVSGDVFQFSTLPKAFGDANALIIATGSSDPTNPLGPFNVDFQGTLNLIALARQRGVKKVVLVTSIGTDELLNALNLFWGVLFWKKRAEEELQRSGIDFTIIRPGGLKSELKQGEAEGVIVMKGPGFYGVPPILPRSNAVPAGSILRRQVAEVCVAALVEPAASGKVVEIIASINANPTPLADLRAWKRRELATGPLLNMQLHSSTEADPAEPAPEWDALPQGVWVQVAAHLNTVDDLWALTQACKSLHSLRPHPQLLAWRKVLVDLAKAVHAANKWIRACKHNVWHLFEDLPEECYMPPPPQAFLDAFYPAAVASMHCGLRERPVVAELLGATECTNMVTADDVAAERELYEIADGPSWAAFIEGAEVLMWKKGSMGVSWTVWVCDGIEEVVRSLQEHGTRLLESQVPATSEVWADHRFEKAIVDDDCELVDLSNWIPAHVQELDAPLAEALLEME
ncbi:hypothetical protein FOA52_004949 [Chlamydomonas sp. UWO 241]|nr:hypothetical protein FOA52_004949 [Chlamydomonas sp. UWO 241]